MYFSDVIGTTFTTWRGDTTVLMQASTGAGKTTFILERLLPYAIEQGREILFLSNRKLLQQQMVETLCKKQGIPSEYQPDNSVIEFRGITFMLYQSLQEFIKTKDYYAIPRYFYLVADEIHYLAEDSNFNPDVLYTRKFIEKRNYSVLVAMSATLDGVSPYLLSKTNNWIQVIDTPCFKKYVDNNLTFRSVARGSQDILFVYNINMKKQKFQIFVYEKTEDVVEILNQDNSDSKWLIFQSNKEKATDKIINKLTCSNLFVSADCKEDEKVKKMIRDREYHEKVLIATKVLDNGISLEDEAIRNIVIDTTSKTEFIQMIGRRRNVEGDENPVNLFLPMSSSEHFSSVLHHQIYPALELVSMKPIEALEQAWKFENSYKICRKYFSVQNGKLILNEIARDVLRKKADFYEKMAEAMQKDNNAFLKTQLTWLEEMDNMSEVIFIREEKINKATQGLESILRSKLDKAMGKMEQDEFRESLKPKMMLLCPEMFSHKDRRPGLKVTNAALKQLKMDYFIESKRGKKKGESSTWTVKRCQI